MEFRGGPDSINQGHHFYQEYTILYVYGINLIAGDVQVILFIIQLILAVSNITYFLIVGIRPLIGTFLTI